MVPISASPFCRAAPVRSCCCCNNILAVVVVAAVAVVATDAAAFAVVVIVAAVVVAATVVVAVVSVAAVLSVLPLIFYAAAVEKNVAAVEGVFRLLLFYHMQCIYFISLSILRTRLPHTPVGLEPASP